MAGTKSTKVTRKEDKDDVKIYLPGEESSDDEMEVKEAIESIVNEDSDSEVVDGFVENTEKILIESLPKVPVVQGQKGGKGVVFLGRIPHGFYEEEMRAYFSQFGTVVQLRLSRNKKTGASKHYAFIEFESLSIATIVAETMDNYLLSNRLLKCKVVDASLLHKDTFVGANKKFKALPHNKIERQRHNKVKTIDEHEKQIKRLVNSDSAKKRKIAESGIEYDFPGFAGDVKKTRTVQVAIKATTVEDIEPSSPAKKPVKTTAAKSKKVTKAVKPVKAVPMKAVEKVSKKVATPKKKKAAAVTSPSKKSPSPVKKVAVPSVEKADKVTRKAATKSTIEKTEKKAVAPVEKNVKAVVKKVAEKAVKKATTTAEKKTATPAKKVVAVKEVKVTRASKAASPVKKAASPVKKAATPVKTSPERAAKVTPAKTSLVKKAAKEVKAVKEIKEKVKITPTRSSSRVKK